MEVKVDMKKADLGRKHEGCLELVTCALLFQVNCLR